jgi:short-subunit dehydrogenase
MELSGKTVLLTGATGGIGHAIARELRGRGAGLVLTGRRTDVLEPLAAETGARALAVDLAERPEVERLATEAADVDVLVANAALPASGDVLGYAVEEIDRALDVNLRAPIVLSRLLGERMAERGGGQIVLVSSLAGKSGQARAAVYSATKFGLRGFAQGLRADMRSRNVGVSIVFPGFIRNAGMFADSGTELPRLVGTSTPEAVAKAVARAVERNLFEVDVAPMSVRMMANFAGLAPGASASMARLLGSERIAEQLEAGQRDKR